MKKRKRKWQTLLVKKKEKKNLFIHLTYPLTVRTSKTCVINQWKVTISISCFKVISKERKAGQTDKSSPPQNKVHYHVLAPPPNFLPKHQQGDILSRVPPMSVWVFSVKKICDSSILILGVDVHSIWLMAHPHPPPNWNGINQSY